MEKQTKSISFNLPSLFLAVGIAAAGVAIGFAISQLKAYDRYVTVKGLSERKIQANEAIWQLRFSYSSDTLADLYKGVEQAQTNIKNFMVTQGFDASTLQFEPVTVADHQSYGYSSTQSKGKRFKANTTIVLTTDNVQGVVNTIQKTGALVEKGVVIESSTVRYLFTNLNTLKPKLLDEATANAEKAAETFAENSHSHLKGIRQARQGVVSIANANGSYGENDPVKKVRVVATVEYFLA